MEILKNMKLTGSDILLTIEYLILYKEKVNILFTILYLQFNIEIVGKQYSIDY